MKKINEDNLIKYIRGLIFRILLACLIFLILAIFSKKNQEFKTNIREKLFNNTISFVEINNLYNKYLGGIFPLQRMPSNSVPVFNEELAYIDKRTYLDGVKLTVEKDYLVPSIKEGMVIYIGEKEKYGLTVIIEGIDGIDVWYSALKNVNVKLYDYIEKGDYLASTKEDELILVFQKEGNTVDYKEYIS